MHKAYLKSSNNVSYRSIGTPYSKYNSSTAERMTTNISEISATPEQLKSNNDAIQCRWDWPGTE